jgi:cation transport ATPase
MAERDRYRERVQKLLAQDQEINDTQLKEFRVQLEQNLQAWEDSSQKVRRALVRTIALFLFLYLIGVFFMPMFQVGQREMKAEWMRNLYMAVMGGWFVAMILTFAVGLWMLILYLYKYAPALKRARFDTQTAMILELQQQVEQLRQDMERRKPS